MLYKNINTGELLTKEEMELQFREEYDGDDPTNSLDRSEYYIEVSNLS